MLEMLNFEILWNNGNDNDLFEYKGGRFTSCASKWCEGIIKRETHNFELSHRFVINITGVKDWFDRSEAYGIACHLCYYLEYKDFDLDNVHINIEEF